jgi:YD repeat-containing protein
VINQWSIKFRSDAAAGKQISDSYISNGEFVENDTQYDASGRVISTTSGKVSRISDGVVLKAGITNSTHYNLIGQVDYTTDQYGGVTHNYYDVMGNLVETVTPDGTETRTAYDAMNRPYLTMDRFNPTDGATANGTLTIYDSAGRVTSTQRLSGVQINVSIDGTTSIATATVARQGTVRSSTTTLYDSAGRVVETDSSSGLENGTLYYPNGQVQYSGVLSATAISIGSGNWESLGDPHQIFSSYTYYQYDLTDSLPSGAVSYDAVTDANNHTTKTYKNALGQIIKTVYDNGKSTSETYDAQGNKASQTDELGRVTSYKYNDAGELIEVDQPQIPDPAHSNTLVTPVTKYTYDANGNELTQTDANNHTTTFTYDALGDELTRTLPDGESESFTYDSFGREATHTDFDGNVATYHYDSLGREDQIIYTGASGSGKTTQTVTYTYDNLGRQHSVTDASGTTTYSYDADGNEIEADTPEGNIHYVYDNLDQHTETFTDNTDIVYGYDTQGRLTTTTVKKLNGNAVNLVTTDGYDSVGNKTNEILPNGVETDYTYDDLNRLTDVMEKKGTTTLFSQHYILNDDGTRASDTETELQSDGSTETISSSWSYDALDRLTGETLTNSASGQSFSDSYTYDLVGNRLTKTHIGPGGGESDTITSTYNGDDQLTSEVSTLNGETDFTYDANGSQTNDGNHKYVYDVRNKLSQVTGEGNNVIASYVYDDAGNRVRETTGGATTFYLTDSDNPTGYAQPIEQKSSATSAPTITYIIGDRILAQANASSGMTYLLTDGGGSTRLLASSTGAVISTLNYAAFGEAINFDPTTIGTMSQFGGDSMYDLASGLNFHGSGRQSSDYRFITRDDPGYADNFNPLTLNLSLLDGADGVNGRDPSGHFDLVDVLLVSGIIATGLSMTAYHAYNSATNATYAYANGQFLKGTQYLEQEVMDLLSLGPTGPFAPNTPGYGVAVLAIDMESVSTSIAIALIQPTIDAFSAMIHPSTGSGSSSNQSSQPSKINAIEERIQHVKDRHFQGGSRTNNKSLFNSSEDINQLIEYASQNGKPVQANGGRLAWIIRAGRNVGFDRNAGNAATDIYTVITESNGDLVTMHPGMPEGVEPQP